MFLITVMFICEGFKRIFLLMAPKNIKFLVFTNRALKICAEKHTNLYIKSKTKTIYESE